MPQKREKNATVCSVRKLKKKREKKHLSHRSQTITMMMLVVKMIVDEVRQQILRLRANMAVAVGSGV